MRDIKTPAETPTRPVAPIQSERELHNKRVRNQERTTRKIKSIFLDQGPADE